MIDYLLDSVFPGLKSLSVPVSLSTLHEGGMPQDKKEQTLKQVNEYRAELSAKSDEQLRELLKDSTKQREARQQQAERLESQFQEELRVQSERQLAPSDDPVANLDEVSEMRRQRAERLESKRFFNHPNAKADFAYWMKKAYWTLDEAVALMLGRSPDVVTRVKMQPYMHTSPVAAKYARIYDLVLRAQRSRQLPSRLIPEKFLAWAKHTGIDVPAELVEAVEARGGIVDWKSSYDALMVQFDAILKERDQVAAFGESLIKERDALKERVATLQAQAEAWEFDVDADNYPLELDAAMQAWRAVTVSRQDGISVKQQVLEWLRKAYPRFTKERKDRIARVCNWERLGGRPTQSA